MSLDITPLVGQDTLLSCWRALADTTFGPGRLIETAHAAAAVFPQFRYFNNAILTSSLAAGEMHAVLASLSEIYAEAGVPTWALWIPNAAASLDGRADRVDELGPLTRDVTTLVMKRTLTGDLRRDDRVTTVSDVVLRRLVLDEAVPVRELGTSGPAAPVTGWALVADEHAVATAYTHRHGDDCGIYAVGTLQPWRRRGLARRLVEHILADAFDAGLRTATLQSTPMGLPLYRALGFRAAGRYEEWLCGASS